MTQRLSLIGSGYAVLLAVKGGAPCCAGLEVRDLFGGGCGGCWGGVVRRLPCNARGLLGGCVAERRCFVGTILTWHAHGLLGGLQMRPVAHGFSRLSVRFRACWGSVVLAGGERGAGPVGAEDACARALCGLTRACVRDRIEE